MDNFQTSFIPKKPIMAMPTNDYSPRPKMSIILFISLVIFIITLVTATILYFYKASIISSINGYQNSLKLAQGSFQQEQIAELQVYDKRMKASKQILASHVITSPIFTLLSNLTIPTIQFTKFSLDPSIEGNKFAVHMSGLARDYRSIAVQANVFNTSEGSKYFKDVVFSNLTLQSDKINKGFVGFDINFSIDPTLLSYDNSVLINKDNTQ